MPLNEATMDHLLAGVLKKHNPRLYDYLKLMLRNNISVEDIMNKVEERAKPNSMTYLTILGALNHLKREMEN